MVDKIYAMSSFLQFRTVYDQNIKFSEKLGYPLKKNYSENRLQINTSEELHNYIKSYIEQKTADGKAALALSGGIDSAIFAKFMPKNSIAYTFKCVVPERNVIDETEKAKYFCDINNLEQRIVEVYWKDFEEYVPILMKNKNAPMHSIEVQIYKAAIQAKKDGFDKLIFAEGADAIFGGLNSLLSKDFTIGEFIDRYSFVLPYKVLKQFILVLEPYKYVCKNGYIDVHSFIDRQFFLEYMNSYFNACECANIEFATPFINLVHKPLDIMRVRNGDSKYLVREVFKRLYPDADMAPKIPMPRPMDEWFANWEGPKRSEFWENCHVNLTGDQKYYVWILENFLNLFDKE
jgi:asparagine synthetase B (glutamine-hydrolysing)